MRRAGSETGSRNHTRKIGRLTAFGCKAVKLGQYGRRRVLSSTVLYAGDSRYRPGAPATHLSSALALLHSATVLTFTLGLLIKSNTKETETSGCAHACAVNVHGTLSSDQLRLPLCRSGVLTTRPRRSASISSARARLSTICWRRRWASRSSFTSGNIFLTPVLLQPASTRSVEAALWDHERRHGRAAWRSERAAATGLASLR